MPDNPHFTIEPAPPFEMAPLEPNELFRGSSWSVYLEDQIYFLEYISGEHSGRLKRIAVSPDQAEQLMAGETTPESVLLRYGTS